MRIAWVVCTYNRPRLLPRVIRCFEQQTYADRCMLILDDGGQYENQSGNEGRWQLVSVPNRYSSLGAKRNASIEIACNRFPGTEAVCPVDDDDLVLPWHTEATVTALQQAEWSRPAQVLAPIRGRADWRLVANYTGHRLDQRRERLYHPCWGMRLSAIERGGWYPPHKSGPEDRHLMLEMERRGVTQADYCELGYPPGYIYLWTPKISISSFLSAADPDGIEAWKQSEHLLEPATLETWQPPFDLSNPPVTPGVALRPF